jgi:hypothetical protein
MTAAERWIASGLISSALMVGTARADHEPATPRNVVERQLGSLRIAAQLPTAFSGCTTHTKGFPEEEYLAFFDLPDDPAKSVMLSVNVDCLDETHQPAACTPSRPRFVKFLSITRNPYQAERIQPRCKLPLNPKDLSTSRGVALGDSIQKVLSQYGPASVNNSLARQDSPRKFYIVYTNSAETGDDREVLFRFENRSVVEIMITMYGEGEADWRRELSNKALQPDGASRRR